MTITAEMVKDFIERKIAFDMKRRGKVDAGQMAECEKVLALIEKTGNYEFTSYEAEKINMAIISEIASKN